MGLDAADYPNYGLDEDTRAEVTPARLQFEREHREQVDRDAELERLAYEAEKFSNAYAAESLKY